MSCKSQLFAITVLALSMATPAMALNPQPLPPGRSFSAQALNPHNDQAHRLEQPRCHSVQVGDPRKQPPMQVCP